MTMISMRKSGRQRLVTDRTTPTAVVNTSITREVCTKLERIADARGMSKAALLRELIEKHVDENGLLHGD